MEKGPEIKVQETVSLRPCPFCGGQGRMGKVHSGVAVGWVIFCLRCKAFGPTKDAPGMAIQAWQERVEGGIITL